MNLFIFIRNDREVDLLKTEEQEFALVSALSVDQGVSDSDPTPEANQVQQQRNHPRFKIFLVLLTFPPFS